MFFMMAFLGATCLVEQFQTPPYLSANLKLKYRRSYEKPAIQKFLNRPAQTGKDNVYFGSDISEVESKKFFMMETMGLSNQPMDRVWGILRDAERYDEYLPFMKLTKKIGVAPNKAEIYDVKFGLRGFDVHSKVQVLTCQDQGETREFQFVVTEGGFQGMEGRYVIEPWKASKTGNMKTSTHLIYMEVHWMTEKITIPQWILEFGLQFALQRIGQSFLNEVNRR